MYGSSAPEHFSHIDPSSVINDCRERNIEIVPYYSDLYPKLLLEIKNPPPLLFVKGDISLLKTKCFSIVGSRYPSAAGIKLTREWSSALSKVFTIVSGVAEGIDSYAHASSGKNIIGVLPCGIDRRKNNGLLISESFPRTKVSFFASRNRIVSGLSRFLLVMEARIKSGTMNTANIAIEQGRTILAVPGHPLDKQYSGNNYLIQKGKAKLVSSINDIISNSDNTHGTIMHDTFDSIDEVKVYDLLSPVPIHIEYIAEILNIDFNSVQVIISRLEIKRDNIIVSGNGMVSKI